MKRILIRTSAALAVTCAVTLAAMPAQAQSADMNVMQNGQATKSNSDRKRYCIVDRLTGSAIPVKVCKTRKEWQAEGVEIPSNL